MYAFSRDVAHDDGDAVRALRYEIVEIPADLQGRAIAGGEGHALHLRRGARKEAVLHPARELKVPFDEFAFHQLLMCMRLLDGE